jgi:formyl-CoA transferase
MDFLRNHQRWFMPQALEDVKVLDLSRILAMSSCSMMLGDLGAEIIRVERPGAGDETRQWGPPWKGDPFAYYLSINRSKKSITVDLKKKEGLEIILQLARRSGVLGYASGAIGRLREEKAI